MSRYTIELRFLGRRTSWFAKTKIGATARLTALLMKYPEASVTEHESIQQSTITGYPEVRCGAFVVDAEYGHSWTKIGTSDEHCKLCSISSANDLVSKPCPGGHAGQPYR